MADATSPTVLYSEQVDISSRLDRIFAAFWQKLHQRQQATDLQEAYSPWRLLEKLQHKTSVSILTLARYRRERERPLKMENLSLAHYAALMLGDHTLDLPKEL
ncbi:Hypothetical predicted protein [Pelobates cultripes]|uniref:Uncharacterized protein n=1 Tax=Pelobates cultripes TaxID=61616 RepID=A0AAD1QXK3_PELCU|nr:Hypothetical predicted protein [Pelobates cultripes]